jgi:hypothetical protein
MGWSGHVACMRRREVRTDRGKPVGKRQLGTSWRIWEDNIKMDIQKVSWVHGRD